MAANMMKRTQRSGYEAQFLVVNAWFGTRPMIRNALGRDVCPILRMKKGSMKYRAAIKGQKNELLDAKELYAHAVKHRWIKVQGLPWKAEALDVEVGLSEQKQDPLSG